MLGVCDPVCSSFQGSKNIVCPGIGKDFLAGTDLAAHDEPVIEDGSTLLSLLQRCGNGDPVAFRLLYDAQASRLYGLALRITRQPSLAGDAVHDALLQVWQRAARFDPQRGSPEAWLTSLVRYRAIDLMRKRARETSGLDMSEELDTAPGPLERLMTTAAGQALHRCLSSLDDQQRRVILLAFMEGLSHAELAERLSAPLGTVKSWVRRALLALKACLEL